MTRARPPTIMVGGLCINPEIIKASLGPTTSTFMLKHIFKSCPESRRKTETAFFGFKNGFYTLSTKCDFFWLLLLFRSHGRIVA
jgi:hypothetical protein